MEDWQKTKIKENLPSLLTLTTCNASVFAILKADGVLSDDDIEEIEIAVGGYDKVKCLYDILFTKCDGYFKLVNALIKTQQSGATQILLKIAAAQIIDLKVTFLQTIYKLKDILEPAQLQGIQSWLLTNVSSEECLEIEELIFKPNTVMQLIQDTIPPKPKNYVPRVLSHRMALDPNIFKENSVDVFVFKNTKRSLIKKFIPSGSISFSTNQLLQNKIEARFILLDNDNDWEKLQNRFDTPIHLLKYEAVTETFILEATSGFSVLLNKFVNHTGNPYVQDILEDDFVNDIIAENVRSICICDTPGMGKSLLLANLGRIIRQKYSDKIVAYIPLQKFVLSCNRIKESNTCSQSMIVQYISTSKLASRILSELVQNQKVGLELLFDGFEEIPEGHLKLATTILQDIVKHLPVARVYVTSRPVMRNKLEQMLGTIAYNIQPFNEKIQLKFLATYWAQEDPLSDLLKLGEYARFCVMSAKKSLRENEMNITGVPLQCRLMAEVYSEEAAVYADKTRNTTVKLSTNFVNSLAEIYSKFLTRQLGKIHCNFSCMFKTSSAKMCDLTCQVRSYHVWQALNIIFPETASKMYQHVATFENLSSQNILSPGILETDQYNTNFQFVHRTFAEYLVAEYYAKGIFTTTSSSQQHMKNQDLFEQWAFNDIFVPSDELWETNSDILCEIRESVVAYFLNNTLTGEQIVCTSKMSPMKTEFLDTLEGILHYDYEGLLEVYLKAIENNELDQTTNSAEFMGKVEEEAKSFRDDEGFELLQATAVRVLLILAKCCSIKTITRILTFFLEILNFDLLKEGSGSEEMTKIIEIAIEHPNYEVFRYFIERMPLENKGYVYNCVENTYSEDAEILEKKLDIANMLLSKCSSLISEPWKNCVSPLLAKNVHLKAIRFLVEHGADVRVSDAKGRTVLYFGICYMTEKDCFELAHFLYTDCNATDLFVEPARRKVYFYRLKYSQIKHKTRTALRFLRLVSQTNIFASVLQSTNQALLDKFCIEHAQSPFEIATSLTNPISFRKYKRIFHFLFYAALAEDHVNIADLLVSYDFSLLQMKYELGQTPILLATRYKSFNMVKFLLTRGASIFEVDKNGRTILHIGAFSGNSIVFQNIMDLLIEHTHVAPTHHEYKNMPEPGTISATNSQPSNTRDLLIWQTKRVLRTPLHYTVKYLRDMPTETIKLLVTFGKPSDSEDHNLDLLNINAVDYKGNTTLQLALIEKQSLELIRYLIDSGADWSVKNMYGWNAAHIAASRGLSEHLKYLVELGCSADELDLKGNNALQRAVFFPVGSIGSEEISGVIKVLIDAGVNKLNKNQRGKTAYNIATKNGYFSEVLSLL